ncbi:ANTAR domain-containing protein [Flindersiella endophytica]
MSDGSFRRANGDPAEILSELSRALSDTHDIARLLQNLTDLAVHVLPGEFEASITILGEDKPRTAAYTSEALLPIDEMQYSFGGGPCVEAARTRMPQRVDVEKAADQWPDFAEAAKQAGLLGYLTSPLIVGTECVGAFNLYSARTDEFDRLDEALLSLFVTAALAAVVSTHRSARAKALAGQFEEAMLTRQYIGEATGVLAERHGVGLDAAFDLLVQQSQHSNVRLREVALQVSGREIPPPAAHDGRPAADGQPSGDGSVTVRHRSGSGPRA